MRVKALITWFLWCSTHVVAKNKNKKKTIVVGTLAESFHRSEALVAVRLLEQRGYTVEMRGFDEKVGHARTFERFFNGTYDLLPSVWLPTGHEEYVKDYVLGVDYDIISSTSDQNQYFIAVSQAAYDNGTKSVTDLETPSPQMKRKIWGPSTSVALGLVGAAMVAELNAQIGSNYYTYEGNNSAYYGYLAKAYAKNDDEQFALAWFTGGWWGEVLYPNFEPLASTGKYKSIVSSAFYMQH